jgi:hypothetical protein
MSRRSLILAQDALLRSQRRGVPNTRMWSESPLMHDPEWDGLVTEPDYVEPVTLVDRWGGAADGASA